MANSVTRGRIKGFDPAGKGFSEDYVVRRTSRSRSAPLILLNWDLRLDRERRPNRPHGPTSGSRPMPDNQPGGGRQPANCWWVPVVRMLLE